MIERKRTDNEAKAAQDPRTPVSKERILREAARLADEEGFESLSMRALGKRLGVEAMSLYNHIANKEEMLDGMADLALTEIYLPDASDDWRTAMRRRAVSAREAFARHPWLSALVDSHPGGGPGRLRYLESVIACLRRAGFSLNSSARAFSLLDSYIYGFARQSVNIAAAEASSADAAADFLSALPTEEYPFLAELAADRAAGSGYDEAADFEFGLGIILEGLQRLLESELD